MTVQLRHYTILDDAWQAIVAVYSEVRAPCCTCRTTRWPGSGSG
ncbi:hypothetical protein ACFQZC_38475 [Streptacidiphilus monticola]